MKYKTIRLSGKKNKNKDYLHDLGTKKDVKKKTTKALTITNKSELIQNRYFNSSKVTIKKLNQRMEKRFAVHACDKESCLGCMKNFHIPIRKTNKQTLN